MTEIIENIGYKMDECVIMFFFKKKIVSDNVNKINMLSNYTLLQAVLLENQTNKLTIKKTKIPNSLIYMP